MAYTGKMRRNYEIRMKACNKSGTKMDWNWIKGKRRMKSKCVRKRREDIGEGQFTRRMSCGEAGSMMIAR
jgi:hypothetical protein